MRIGTVLLFLSVFLGTAHSQVLGPYPVNNQPDALFRFSLSQMISWNSAYPYGRYDGSLWQGKGWSLSSTVGVQWQTQNWHLQWKPQGMWIENQTFDTSLVVTNPSIDQPVRFQDSPAIWWSWGESILRYQNEWVRVDIGTQSLGFGPMKHYPILLSNEAGGFPHLLFSLWNTQWFAGQLEGSLLWGHLEASAERKAINTDSDRVFSGFFASYAPNWVPGLNLSVGRTLISRASQWDWDTALQVLSVNRPRNSDQTDQRISFAWEWVFPEVEFSFYGEWARNDFSPKMIYVILNPTHSAAWSMGLKKTLDWGVWGRWEWRMELSDLTLPLEQTINKNGYSIGVDFYTHGLIPEGYTYKGQILGSALGNGGSGQILDLLWQPHATANIMVQLGLERWQKQGTYFYSQALKDRYPGDNWELVNNVATIVFGGLRWDLQEFNIDAKVDLIREYNRDFRRRTSEDYLHIELGVSRSFP